MYFNMLFQANHRREEDLVDIHCHILHGVDDGSGDIADSLEMAQLAAANGTKAIFATPHSNMPHYFENFWSAQFEQKLSDFQKKLDGCGVDLQIYCGQEIYLEEGFLQLLRRNELITLNRSRYALVELDFYERTDDAYKKIAALVSEGYVPVVAHPERYAFVAEDKYAAAKLRQLGALLQINSGSLSGDFGTKPKRIAVSMLENRLADFVASDAHSQYSRTPDLSKAHEFICENFSYEYADLLFRINPKRVINNDEIR